MKTLEELRKIREKAKEQMKMRNSDYRVKIVVGMGTSGIATGAREVMKTILDEISNRHLTDVLVTQTGEKGLASMEPVVDVIIKDEEKFTYVNITPEKAKRIIAEHIVNNKPVEEYIVKTADKEV